MQPFTHAQIADIRRLRRSEARMATICALFPTHTRDEIVEAVWAVVRYDSNTDALTHVNLVLNLQIGGVPLINGKEAWKVTVDRGRVSYAPGF